MLKYYFCSNDDPFVTPTNDGIGSVSGLLDQLHEQGIPVDLVDVAELTERGRADAYLDAVRAFVLKKYKIRQVFGSKWMRGTFFWEAGARIDPVESCQWTSRRGISAPRAWRSCVDRSVSSGLY